MTSPPAHPPTDLWQRALDGDRDAFEEALAPHRDTLLDAARRALSARIAEGQLRERVLTPEELVGETLLRAFDHRARYEPEQMRMRAWLIGIQYRTLNRLVRAEQRYDEQKAISLDAEVPARREQDAVEEEFYEFRQPFDVTTYEEMIPGSRPADVEVDLRGQTLSREELNQLDAGGLLSEQRQIAEFHDEFELSLPEIAQIIEYSLQDTAEALGEARVHLRQYIGSTDVERTAEDEPIDSYTGEPIRDNPAYPSDYPAERGTPLTDSDPDNAPTA